MRPLLATFLGIGAASAIFLPDPLGSLLALVIMLLAFLLGAAKLAVDLIELIPADLVADAAVVVIVGIALTRITSGSGVLVGALLAAALVAEALPPAVERVRARDG
jgi:hypothetical protein